MRRATAMPSAKTDYYDEVRQWNMAIHILCSCIHLLCCAFSSEWNSPETCVQVFEALVHVRRLGGEPGNIPGNHGYNVLRSPCKILKIMLQKKLKYKKHTRTSTVRIIGVLSSSTIAVASSSRRSVCWDAEGKTATKWMVDEIRAVVLLRFIQNFCYLCKLKVPIRNLALWSIHWTLYVFVTYSVSTKGGLYSSDNYC